MMYENDRYEIPREVLLMSHDQIKQELKKAHSQMVNNPKRRPKKQIKRNISFNF